MALVRKSVYRRQGKIMPASNAGTNEIAEPRAAVQIMLTSPVYNVTTNNTSPP